MRGNELLDKMALVDAAFVEEADRQPPAKKPAWIKWGAVAACLAVIVFAGIKLFPQSNNGLPMLTLPDEAGATMGFEGWLGYDMTEWDNGNPWDASMELASLPVYKNGSYSIFGKPVGLKKDAMMERLEATVEKLGIEDYQIETEKDGLTVEQIVAKTEDIRVEVDANGTIEVWFEDGLELPEEYSFAHYDITPAEAEQALEYLTGQYAHLLGFEQPQIVLSGSYFMWHGYDEVGNYLYDENGNHLEMPKYDYEYIVYDAAGDDIEDMLNYTYRYVRFAPDDNGNLSLIRIYDGLCCAEKLGDYPIITMDEAYDLLLNGSYLTTVPYKITDPELIKGAELVYRNYRREETFIPYYRFYIELPDMRRENGLVDFGAYYVPAIQGEYITNMPIWDGRLY